MRFFKRKLHWHALKLAMNGCRFIIIAHIMRIRTAYRRWFLPGVILSATVIIFLSVCGLYIYFNKPGVISIGWSQIRCESLQPANVHDSRPDSKHRTVQSYFSAADSRALLDELDAVDATARLEVDEYEIIFAEEMTRKSRAAQLQSPTFPFESDSLLRTGRVALAVGALSKVLKYWNVERLFTPMARAPDADANRISGHNAPFFVLSSYHAIRNGYVRRKVPGRINE